MLCTFIGVNPSIQLSNFAQNSKCSIAYSVLASHILKWEGEVSGLQNDIKVLSLVAYYGLINPCCKS